MKVVPFRKFWPDCENLILYTMIDSFWKVPDTYFYHNCYEYILSEEHGVQEKDRYYSIKAYSDSSDTLYKLTQNYQQLALYQQEDPIIDI